MSEQLPEVKKEGAVATLSFEDDAGGGFENQTSRDITIPRLVILQNEKNQIVKSGAPGAEPGCLWNTITKTPYPGEEGVVLVPCVTTRGFGEFTPKKQGGGYHGERSADSSVVKRARATVKKFGGDPNFGKLYTSYDDAGNGIGNELIETVHLYCVQLADDLKTILGMVVLDISSTNLKFYTAWNTSISMFLDDKANGAGKYIPPMFSHVLRIWLQENDYPGGSAYNYQFSPVNGTIENSRVTSEVVYRAAKKLRDMVQEGSAKAEAPTDEGVGAEDDDSIPF